MMAPSVLQFVPQICRHDAVGNGVLGMHQAMHELGVECQIACDRSDLASAPHVRSWASVKRQAWDALLLHYSHGCAARERLLSRGERIILIYHGITPPEYFRGTNPRLEEASRQGIAELPLWAEKTDYAIAHSTFTANELKNAGFRNVTVIPYVAYEPLYAQPPDRSLIANYDHEGWVNLLTVGRVAPNKCLEDCLFIFDYFQRAIHRKSRLFIVGSWDGTEAYLDRLLRLRSRLGTQDVVFTGPVSQAALLAFFQLADAYLCMSGHEGFGVPLLEAMRFGVPVFAHAAAAIPETLRGTGILFSKKEWAVISEAIGLLLADGDLRSRVCDEERLQAQYYGFEAGRERLKHFLTRAGICESCRMEVVQ